MEKVTIIQKNSLYYPNSFSQLNPPPSTLYATGNLSLLHTFCIGIVGARACCQDSILLAKHFASELSKRGVTIISGMADGIDQIAHEACIQSGGKTIAVIGSGMDVAEKKKIFHHILKHDGLILTEYSSSSPALPYHFPRRNSILVALSKGVIAIETHLKSGTMVTAQEAFQQKVPLFTIPR